MAGSCKALIEHIQLRKLCLRNGKLHEFCSPLTHPLAVLPKTKTSFVQHEHEQHPQLAFTKLNVQKLQAHEAERGRVGLCLQNEEGSSITHL